MLALPLRLLEEQAAARRVLEEAYRYVLADEAQDVSAPQYRLLSRLAARHRNLALVADARQAIFGWRGADAGYLRTFREDFPDARTFGLNENFRSTGRIVALANALGAPLGGQRLWTRNPAGEPPSLHVAPDERGEAALVVERIRRLRDDGAVGRLDDVAVLYRTNRQAEALALALRRAELPYRVRPHGDPFGRREVRDALAYLRLAHDPDDAPALARVVDTPPRGLGRLVGPLRRRPVPARDLPVLAGAFGPAAVYAAQALLSLVRDLHARAADRPADLLDLALEQSGYHAWLVDQPDGAARLGHLAALRALAVEARCDLTAWLAGLALDGVAPAGPERERVLLTTVHGSKGGEWSVVFVVGADEGLLPLLRTGRETAADLEEERRVAFVAVTRPRSRLYLSYSRQRSRDGRLEPRRLSRFLRELPSGLLAPAV
jgi:DNA helicase-2/ATP-dependent DNA helicase PcrA